MWLRFSKCTENVQSWSRNLARAVRIVLQSVCGNILRAEINFLSFLTFHTLFLWEMIYLVIKSFITESAICCMLDVLYIVKKNVLCFVIKLKIWNVSMQINIEICTAFN